MKKTYCNRNEACYLHITRLKTLLLSGSVCDLGIKTEPILLENFLELFTGGYFRPWEPRIGVRARSRDVSAYWRLKL